MNRMNEHFISAADYFFMRDIGIPYDGYVEGMGYVSNDIAILPSAYYAYENPPRLIHPNDSLFITMNVARLDNREESVARSYHLTTQEISEQIVRDGYVVFPGGKRIDLPKNCGLTVEITTEERQGQDVDTLRIKVEDRDTGNSYESTCTMANFLKGVHVFNDVFGFAMTGIEMTDTPASFRIYRNKGETFSPKLYKSGWSGGSAGRIKTYKVLKVAKEVGDAFVIGNIVIDVLLLVDGAQSFTKTAMNIGAGALCLVIGGIPGLVIGISYFALDQCGLIDPIADYMGDIFTTGPVPDYRPDPSVIQSDNTRVVIEHPPLPIIFNKN